MVRSEVNVAVTGRQFDGTNPPVIPIYFPHNRTQNRFDSLFMDSVLDPTAERHLVVEDRRPLTSAVVQVASGAEVPKDVVGDSVGELIVLVRVWPVGVKSSKRADDAIDRLTSEGIGRPSLRTTVVAVMASSTRRMSRFSVIRSRRSSNGHPTLAPRSTQGSLDKHYSRSRVSRSIVRIAARE